MLGLLGIESASPLLSGLGHKDQGLGLENASKC